MIFNGKKLLLDNFRSVLSNYSIDIQDIVRSAILDDVDITKYIVSCKDTPYRLDQIRLSMKEGLSENFFSITSGEVLYKIRVLKKKKVDLTLLKNQLDQGILSDNHLLYLLNWIEDGVNISGINISIIPKNLLEVFDYGLRNNMNMKQFNNGISYNEDYIKYCLQIENAGKSVKPFLSGTWKKSVLEILSKFSKVSSEVWNALILYIDSETPIGRLDKLIELVKSNISIKDLQKKSKGSYVYDIRCLDIVYSAYTHGLNYEELIKKSVDPDEMQDLFNNMWLSKVNKVSGRLKKI